MAIWAFLSDIHGNYAALERAVALARARGAVRFAFLGDLLGRGDSDRCVDLVRQVADLSVVGNRDLDWRDRVSQASRAYVLSLPRLAEAEDFLIIHGIPELTPGLGSRDVRSGLVGAYQRLTQSGRRLLFSVTPTTPAFGKRTAQPSRRSRLRTNRSSSRRRPAGCT